MERVVVVPSRDLMQKELEADFVIAGGGIAGVCAAIAAAREGVKTILVQDRPVLGGNASSEVRLWALGATSNMGNNNRWAREGGVADDITSENFWRNPEGNPVVYDAVLLDAVWNEPNLRVLLDTVVHDLEKDGTRIRAIKAYCSPASTSYRISAPLFCDASGDGILGYLAGAAFRVGAEKPEEFGEPLAPDKEYGELLGTTIYFYSKDTKKPVRFVAPDFALKDITAIPRYERIQARDHGGSFWWLEFGGRLDTIADAAVIKRELLKVVYGVWDHIKNSGRFPEAANLTLEWVGKVPGKRESRRFEGDYMLVQDDIIEQKLHADAVSFGGWSIDLHPGDGIYSDKPPCNQYHARGVYQIPYRCFYSRDVPNLFLTGRLISASHVAFGSTRVMLTGGNNGQAVGVAAALCRERGVEPRALSKGEVPKALQYRLSRIGQFIPHLSPVDPDDLIPGAEIEATAPPGISELPESGSAHRVKRPEGMLIPFGAGPLPALGIRVEAEADAVLRLELRRSEYYGNFSPDQVIESLELPLAAGARETLRVQFSTVLERAEYLTVVMLPTEGLLLRESRLRYPGILHLENEKPGRRALQEAERGAPRLEFWLPERRPNDYFWSMTFDPMLEPYAAAYVGGGYDRPFIEANGWAVEAKKAGEAYIRFRWKKKQRISRLIVSMDGDFDHAMESVQFDHPDRVSPFLPEKLEVVDEAGQIVASAEHIHMARWDHRFALPLYSESITLRFPSLHGDVMSLYRVRAYQ